MASQTRGMRKRQRFVPAFILALHLCAPVWAQPEQFLEELPQLKAMMREQPEVFRGRFQDWMAKGESWSSGEAKAKLMLLRAHDCAMRGDRQGELEYFRTALKSWNDRLFLTDTNLRLAHSLLMANQVEASRSAVKDALASMPADPPDIVLELLLQYKRMEARLRGDSGAEFTDLLVRESIHRGQEMRDCLDFAWWYEQHNLPDGQLLWWTRAVERMQHDTTRSKPDQWMELWRHAPVEKLPWVESQLMFSLDSLPAAQRAQRLLGMTRELSFRSVSLERKLSFIPPLREILREQPDARLELELERELVSIYELVDPEQKLTAALRALDIVGRMPVDQQSARTVGQLFFTTATAYESLGRNQESIGYYRRGLAHSLLHDPHQANLFFSRALALVKKLELKEELVNLRATLEQEFSRLPETSRGMALQALVDSYGDQESQEKLAVLTRLREHYRTQMEAGRSRENWDLFADSGRSLARTLARGGDRRSERQVLESLLSEPLSTRSRQLVEHELFGCLKSPADDGLAEKLAIRLLTYPAGSLRLNSIQNIAMYRYFRSDYEGALSLLDLEEVRTSNRSYLIELRWRCLRSLKRWNEAWQALADLEKAFPNEARQNAIGNDYARALLLQDQGRWDESTVWMDKAFAQVLLNPKSGQAGQYIRFLNYRKRPWREAFEKAMAVSAEPERIGLVLYLRKLLGDKEARRLLSSYHLENGSARDRGELAKIYPDLLKGTLTPTATQPPLGAVLDQVRLARPELGNLLTLRSTNIAPLQSHLRSGQWLVCYIPTGVDLLVVMLSHDQALYDRLPLDMGLLERQIKDDWSHLGAGENVKLEQWSNQLIRPIFEKAKPRELMIVPIGELWKLPFPALKSPDGEFLSERPLSLLTSGDLLRLADGHWSDFSGGVFVAAGAPPEADLPGAEAELGAIHRSWPESSLLLGTQATAKALLSWPSKISLLHLATHTHVKSDDPLNSSVQLHQSKLTLSQLFQLPLTDHALVVLSSCRGGVGQNASASEPVSLASALAATGAQSVIANLWDADDESSKLFFSTFYAELRHHSDLSKAFQAAQRVTRKKFPEPFYWAGFSLIGSPH